MATQVLHCPGCNVNFRAKTYDPAKTYKCPKCGGRLHTQAAGKGGDGVALESKSQGKRDAAKDPLVGRRIGQYKILKKLGQGGMGAVYQAVHLDLDRTVALKILPPGLAHDDPDAIERFKREARSAAVLNHPNVVTTHNVGSDGQHHFIEQEFVDGQSLQQRLEREGKLPVDDATRIVQDAAGALGAAHKQNIIHRDIKPANIMLTREGQVKVMDFGLAKDVTGATQLTVSGHIMGTPHYMSPEQCEAKKADARADIYSLGATYYHLLTGSFPYAGDSLLSILRQQTDAPVPQVRDKRPDAPASVQPVIDRAMAKKPEDRFQTMEEFAAALAQVQRSAAGSARARESGVEASAGQAARAPAAQPANRPPSGGTTGGQDGAQPFAVRRTVDRGRDAEAAEGRSHRVPGIGTASGSEEPIPRAAGLKLIAVVSAGLVLACVVGWQVVAHWPKGEKISTKEVTEKTPQSAFRTPQSAIPSASSVVKEAEAKLPPGFEKAFMLPDSDKDQHGNPVVVRNGSRFDPETGWPYEVWLKEPRMEFVLIPAGEFMMGCSEDDKDGREEESPRHRVRITKPFTISKYEVTVYQFRQFVQAANYTTEAEKPGAAVVPRSRKWRARSDATWRNPYIPQTDAHPVVCVTWNDAEAFCRKETQRHRVVFRLPTEAEWEYVCRAGTQTRLSYGDDPDYRRLDEYAWYRASSVRKAHPVGQKKPNGWGLYDMHGNAREWCSDWYDGEYYATSPASDPPGPGTGSQRVSRGGAWNNSAKTTRCARRGRHKAVHVGEFNRLGFRAVVALPAPPVEDRPTGKKRRLPPGFEKAFMLPESDKDQHGNPVVTRNGIRFDPKTGWPYEIWCRVRRAHQTDQEPGGQGDGARGAPYMEFVLIPAGEFLMGSSEEEIKRLEEKYKRDLAKTPDRFSREGPQHRVRITKPFYMAKYETTVAQFRWFVDKTGYRTDAEKRGGAYVSAAGKLQTMADANWRNPYFEQGDQNPVACVSWNDAMAFCKALTDEADAEFALPTEAQWEYACRAGSTGQFCYGDDPEAKQLGEYAWYCTNSGRKTHPVGQKRPNAWGLYDVHGNVWEWCQDWYGDHYGSSVGSDPRGPSFGAARVVRGGSWIFIDYCCRGAYRYGFGPDYRYIYVCFRCVVSSLPR